LTHETRSYICMYIKAVTNSVMLQLHLQHDFYKQLKIRAAHLV